jgi:transglutaminase-like putative cysteine protease
VQLEILHETTYRYTEHVHESHTIVHLRPWSDAGQYCTKFELTIAPRARVFSYVDRFGNEVHHFAVLPDHDVLSVAMRSSVVTVRPPGGIAPGPVSRAQLEADPSLPTLFDFLHESTYVLFGPALREFSAQVGAPIDDLAAWYLAAGHAIKATFAYDQSATTVHATVDESVQAGGGVCQDFAHILVALCRLNGIPARYVSGYVVAGSSTLGAEASHAWCEAYLPPYGWIGYDPTNDKLVGDEFVKIAVGRDYRDVSPVRGIYKGPSQSVMSVNVAMDMLSNQ